MPASRRPAATYSDRESLPRTTGLPPGWEFVPAWERGDPLPAPPAPPFDLEGTLEFLSKRLRHGYVREADRIPLPTRMNRREAWFWLNLTVSHEFKPFTALDLDQSPEPEKVRILLRNNPTACDWTHSPQMLLAFFTAEETLDWLFKLETQGYYRELDAMMGVGMFVTPYLQPSQRLALIEHYMGYLSDPPSIGNRQEQAALNLLGALGHSDLFSNLFPVQHVGRTGPRMTMLWLSALPDRDRFLKEATGLHLESWDKMLSHRWWLACVRHHAPERLFPCPDVYRMVAPEIAPVMLGWLTKKGASAPAASWLKRNFEVAVAGLAPLLKTSDQSGAAGAWFTLQWEQNPAKLQSALKLLTDSERQIVQSLQRPVQDLEDVPPAAAGAPAYPPELSPFMERPRKGWSKPPGWLTVSRLTPLAVPGHPVDPGFMQAVLHHLAAPETSGNGFPTALMQCVPAGALENFCAELMQQWTAVQHPKESSWVRLLTARMGGLAGLHELAHIDFERSTIFSRQKLIVDALANSGNPVAAIFLWSIHQTCWTPAAKEGARAGVETMAEAAGLSTPDFLDVQFPVTPRHVTTVASDRTLSLSDFLHRHLVLRFLHEMLSRHRRTYSRMKDDLLAKPMARQVMQQLIWARYSASGDLETTFRIDEEGHPLDADDCPVTFSPGDLTGVVHPVELAPGMIRKWQTLLEDYQIIQPFIQMHRTPCRPTSGESKETSITRFMDLASTGSLISLSCQSSLWLPTNSDLSMDVTRHFRNFEAFGIIACLGHEGAYMPWDNFINFGGHHETGDKALRLREIIFLPNTTPIVKWRNRSHHLPIREVPPLILCEALWLGHQMTGLPLP